jgi:hypothetical protein
MDAGALRDVGHELNELRPDLIDADDDELREVGPLQVGRELGNVRDLLLQVDGEPMEVVDDVAASEWAVTTFSMVRTWKGSRAVRYSGFLARSNSARMWRTQDVFPVPDWPSRMTGL